MSTREIVLNAESRKADSRGETNKLRKEGRVPAILYGGKEKNMVLAVNGKELSSAIRTENAIISLMVEGGGKKNLKNVIVKDIQYHPVRQNILHVDFMQISLTEEIEVMVRIETMGLPVGVDVGGGVLDHTSREVRVKCFPKEIPDKLEADVTALNIGDSIRVKDLKVTGKFKILEDPEKIVVSVVPSVKFEEKAPEVVAEAVEGEVKAEPEVISKGKKEVEEGADGEEKAKPAAEKADKHEKKKPE